MNQAGNPPLSFTAARFNSGIGEEEKSIVTSTGKFVITCEFFRSSRWSELGWEAGLLLLPEGKSV